MGPERVSGISGNLRQDFIRRFGPDEGFGSRIGYAHELRNGGLELAHAGVGGPFDLPLRQQRKPALHQVEP